MQFLLAGHSLINEKSCGQHFFKVWKIYLIFHKLTIDKSPEKNGLAAIFRQASSVLLCQFNLTNSIDLQV